MSVKYMRYILKTPTDTFGHYTIKYFDDLKEAVAKMGKGSFILDTFKQVGYGFKIIRKSKE